MNLNKFAGAVAGLMEHTEKLEKFIADMEHAHEEAIDQKNAEIEHLTDEVNRLQQDYNDLKGERWPHG